MTPVGFVLYDAVGVAMTLDRSDGRRGVFLA